MSWSYTSIRAILGSEWPLLYTQEQHQDIILCTQFCSIMYQVICACFYIPVLVLCTYRTPDTFDIICVGCSLCMPVSNPDDAHKWIISNVPTNCLCTHPVTLLENKVSTLSISIGKLETYYIQQLCLNCMNSRHLAIQGSANWMNN